MDAVDWTGLGVLAALMVGCVGYLARQIDRVRSDMTAGHLELGARIDRQTDSVRSDMTDGHRELGTRIDRLSDAYVRHLEHHAGSGS
jgi:hypothetical protein